MSTYYSFYFGYKKDDKIYPYGPYNRYGKLIAAMERSGGFINNLQDDFTPNRIQDDMFSEELIKDLDIDLTNNYSKALYYLPANELGESNFIKYSYIHMDEIGDYLEELEKCDGYFPEWWFERSYLPTEYGLKVVNALKRNDSEKLEELKHYEFFAYPDITSIEWVRYQLQLMSRNGNMFDSCLAVYYLEKEGIKIEEEDLVYIMRIT